MRQGNVCDRPAMLRDRRVLVVGDEAPVAMEFEELLVGAAAEVGGRASAPSIATGGA
jgi:hypothetical protein